MLKQCFRSRLMLAQDAVAELAYAGAEIAQHVFIAAGDNLGAGRVAAVGAADRKGQDLIHKGIDILRCVE